MSSSDDDNARAGPTRARVGWLPEEDRRLLAAVQVYGFSRGKGSADRWGKISKDVGGGRTAKNCRKRYFHSLNPDLKKGRWTKEEDQRLRELYGILGPKWKEIALQIPGRMDDQVSKRWRDAVNPALRRNEPWAAAEDAMLLALYEQLGPQWAEISERIDGRSPLHCRNRYRRYDRPRCDKAQSSSEGPVEPDSGAEAALSSSATIGDSLFAVASSSNTIMPTPPALDLSAYALPPPPPKLPSIDLSSLSSAPPEVSIPQAPSPSLPFPPSFALTAPFNPSELRDTSAGPALQPAFPTSLEELMNWQAPSAMPAPALSPVRFQPCCHCQGTGFAPLGTEQL